MAVAARPPAPLLLWPPQLLEAHASWSACLLLLLGSFAAAHRSPHPPWTCFCVAAQPRPNHLSWSQPSLVLIARAPRTSANQPRSNRQRPRQSVTQPRSNRQRLRQSATQPRSNREQPPPVCNSTALPPEWRNPRFFHKAASLKVLSEGLGTCHVRIGIWFQLN
jgi:hypothetical protein